MIKTNFLGNGVRKENMHYACIAWVTIGSVMKTNKKKLSVGLFRRIKYKIKKIQMSKFITAELESDSDSDSESDSEAEPKYDTVN